MQVRRLRGSTRKGTASLGLIALCVLAASGSSLAADASGSIELVTVTATRRAVDIQKVSIAATALTEDDLKRQKPVTLEDLSGSAPNVFIGMNTAGPGASAIFIRGQGYADIEKTQNPSVGVALDGVFFGTSTGQLLDMFDTCAVEVDRGPQGIFFGKNTTAGMINVTRCAPTREWGADISASYGSFNDGAIRAILNAPLGDNGGIKVSGQWHTNDGYEYNVFTNKSAGGDRYEALHLVADEDLTDWLSADFSYDFIHQKGGGYPVQFGNVLTATILGYTGFPNYNPKTGSPDGLGVNQVENGGRDSDVLDNNIYSLKLKAQTPIGDLNLQTAYMDERDLVYQDFDGTCAGVPGCTSVGNPLLAATGSVLETIRDQKYRQFTQEVRLSGSFWDQFDYLAGIFYYHHDINLHQNTNAVIDQFSSEGNFSWSGFGNLDWNITDTIKISAGVRDIAETKHFNTYYQLELFGGVPLTPHIHDSKSWNDTITRFAAQWQVTPGSMLYVSRSEGFRSGGFSIRGTLSEQNGAQSNCGVPAGCAYNFLPYLPETNVAYEVGAKNAFFDNSLIFNVDGFITDISNFQVSQVVETPNYGPGTNTYIVNLPKVRIKGLEFELDVRPAEWIPEVDGLTLTANVGIQSARVTQGTVNGQEVALGPGATAGAPGSTADFTGTPLQRVPNDNFSLRGTYVRPVMDGNLTLSTGYTYLAKFSLGNFGTLQDVQPSYGLWDASARFEWDNYYASLSGKNLANVSYRNNSLPTVFFQGWGAPRTILFEVGAHF